MAQEREHPVACHVPEEQHTVLVAPDEARAVHNVGPTVEDEKEKGVRLTY